MSDSNRYVHQLVNIHPTLDIRTVSDSCEHGESDYMKTETLWRHLVGAKNQSVTLLSTENIVKMHHRRNIDPTQDIRTVSDTSQHGASDFNKRLAS